MEKFLFGFGLSELGIYMLPSTETCTFVADCDRPKTNLPPNVPSLTSLYIYAMGACNLACRHCWIVPKFQPYGNNGDHCIPLEFVRKAIAESRSLGLCSVKLTGGEPTLHPQFREIVEILDAAELDIVIETNGTLIDSTLANFLKMKRVCSISVSLDGAKPETHDALRLVPGSHALAIDGIRSLVEVGFRPQVICTLHRGNISEVAELVLLGESIGCGSVKFNVLQQVGRGNWFAEEEGLEVAQIVELYHWVERELVPRSRVQIHFDIPFAFYPIRKLLGNNWGRCRVHNILGLLSGGELSLCGIGATVPDLIYGHIRDDDLREIWCSSPGLIALRESLPLKLEGICGECLHRDLCIGMCVANNYNAIGRLTAPYFFCADAAAQGLFPKSRRKK